MMSSLALGKWYRVPRRPTYCLWAIRELFLGSYTLFFLSEQILSDGL